MLLLLSASHLASNKREDGNDMVLVTRIKLMRTF